MSFERQTPDLPHVSVVLTTRDRPRFLNIVLRCYTEQTYPNRDLIVVDDGSDFPVDESRIEQLGGRVVRAAAGSSIGAKLNAGIEVARGPLIQKMDDDDWYHPRFLETLVRKRTETMYDVCLPALTFIMPFLFFELSTWAIRRSVDFNVPGATLMFDRDDWRERPFRNLPQDEDVWYYRDHRDMGRQITPVGEVELFLAIRHRGVSGDRGHTWTSHHGHGSLEDYLQSRPFHDRRPEEILPEWALKAYREIRAGMIMRQADPIDTA